MSASHLLSEKKNDNLSTWMNKQKKHTKLRADYAQEMLPCERIWIMNALCISSTFKKEEESGCEKNWEDPHQLVLLILLNFNTVVQHTPQLWFVLLYLRFILWIVHAHLPQITELDSLEPLEGNFNDLSPESNYKWWTLSFALIPPLIALSVKPE